MRLLNVFNLVQHKGLMVILWIEGRSVTYGFLLCTYLLEELLSGLFPIQMCGGKGYSVLHTYASDFFLYCFFCGSCFSSVFNMSFVFEIHTDYSAEGILSYGIKMPIEVQQPLYHNPINLDATDNLVATEVWHADLSLWKRAGSEITVFQETF